MLAGPLTPPSSHLSPVEEVVEVAVVEKDVRRSGGSEEGHNETVVIVKSDGGSGG